MKIEQGKLVVLDGCRAYWNGVLVDSTDLVIQSHRKETVVKMRVSGTLESELYTEMREAGIKIRGVK